MKIYKQKNSTNVKIDLNYKELKPFDDSNIIALWHQATEEEKQAKWYNEAQTFAEGIASNYGVSFEKVALVIAALSPMQRWEVNKKQAESAIAWYTSGNDSTPPKFHMFSANNTLVEAIMLDKPFKLGKKVTNFYRNICGDKQVVTVDSLAMSIIIGLHQYAGSYRFNDAPYDYAESLYIKAAEKLGVNPSQLQAVTWVVCRRSKVFSGEKLLGIYTNNSDLSLIDFCKEATK